MALNLDGFAGLSIDFFINIATELDISLDISGLWAKFSAALALGLDLSVNIFWNQIGLYLGSFSELSDYTAEINLALIKFVGFSGDLSIEAQLRAFFELNFSAEIFVIIEKIAFGATFAGLVFILEILIELQE